MDEKIEVEVPIRLTGKAGGNESPAESWATALRELRVRCLPSDIPEFIEVDVSALKIGDSLHVQDITSVGPVRDRGRYQFHPGQCAPPISEAKYEEIVAAPEGGKGDRPARTDWGEERRGAKEGKGAKEAKEPRKPRRPREAKEAKETKESKE